jgi:uncharacterized RDD family membrane protein YckC
MSGDYYILEDGEQTGPFSFDELIDMGLEIHTRVLSPLAEGWLDACDLPEFYPYFEANGIYFPTGDNLASFWWRLLAFIVDYLIICFVLGFILAIVAPGFVTAKMQSYNDMLKMSRNLPYSDVLKLQIILYFAILVNDLIGGLSAMKGSIGKRICKLVVVDIDGTGLNFGKALLRSIGKILSLSFYGLGFLSIFWSEHRQALHDYLAKTYVVKRD